MANFTKPESELTMLSLETKKEADMILKRQIIEARLEKLRKVQEESLQSSSSSEATRLQEESLQSSTSAETKIILTRDEELRIYDVVRAIKSTRVTVQYSIDLLSSVAQSSSNMIYDAVYRSLERYSKSLNNSDSDAVLECKRKVSRVLSEVAWNAKQEAKKAGKKLKNEEKKRAR